ncbi:hypothetical protein Pla111_30330 [Botrimarina hoheduenensis]|uniref:Uncharacterized protein n=1 Tax=Botrimarina hoheduenensis TaxID=2528000 RepID=A0A5C5VUJ0_9BACT|nr:hypothetical protein Pla111_30330 [Botrimarina hoheduenensis]
MSRRVAIWASHASAASGLGFCRPLGVPMPSSRRITRPRFRVIADVSSRLRTFSMPCSHVRREPPVSQTWANDRSARSDRNRCSRLFLAVFVLRRLALTACCCSKGFSLSRDLPRCFGSGM